MEQHPVPQNVTSFQFRLIGDMTLKQFGYLAGGAILGYLAYKLPLPFFFTWPLAVTFAVGGFGFAFVPIEERPMDVWVLSFLKSVYSPTQYVWQKGKPAPAPRATPTRVAPVASPPVTPAIPVAPPPTAPAVPVAPAVAYQQAPAVALSPRVAPPPAAKTRVKTHLPIAEIIAGLFAAHPKAAAPVREVRGPARATELPTAPPPVPTLTKPTVLTLHPKQGIFDWFRSLFRPASQVATVESTATSEIINQAPLPSLTGRRVDLSQPPSSPTPQAPMPSAIEAAEIQAKKTELEAKLLGLQKELESKQTSEQRILELQKQLTDFLSERNKMETELVELRQKVIAQGRPQPVYRPAEAGNWETPSGKPTVKIITSDTAVKAGLPRLTPFPNVVTGIIKDHDGNLLPSVLVTVRDKDDVPLRALKTNKLGQFAASTPLPNGTYLVEVEDPRGQYLFDRVQVTLNGAVAPVLEIVAKSQKQMDRAKLEKEIFGTTTT